MPATPATHFELKQLEDANASTPGPVTDPEESGVSVPKNGGTFQLRYDTLVIAVGAYNQSELGLPRMTLY